MGRFFVYPKTDIDALNDFDRKIGVLDEFYQNRIIRIPEFIKENILHGDRHEQASFVYFAHFFIFHFLVFTKYSHTSDLVSYFQLCFELTTTSSSYLLIMKEGTYILSCRQIRISGGTKKKGISFQRLWGTSFQAGQTIRIAGDFAIVPEAIGQSFPCNSFMEWMG